MRPEMTQAGTDVRLTVRVQPRARKDEIAGTRGSALLVRVTAPPIEGRANQAVCRVVARAAGVPPSRVSVERGTTGRDKVIRIEGITVAELREAIARG